MGARKVAGVSAIVVGLAALTGCAGDHPLLCPDDDVFDEIVRRGGGYQTGELTTVARAQGPDGVITPVKAPAPPPAGTNAARIYATVNGQAILDQEIRALCWGPLMMADGLPEPERSDRQAKIWRATLDQLIGRELALQDAELRFAKNKAVLGKLQEIAAKEFDKQWLRPTMKAQQIADEGVLRDLLRQQGTSYEMVKRSWERNFIAQEYLRNLVFPKIDKIGHPQLLEYYHGHPEEFRVADGVEWVDLFVSAAKHGRDGARAKAEGAAEAFRRGEGYDKVKHLDDGTGALRGGAGIGAKPGEIKPPEAEGPLFRMRDGEVAVLETPTGFHVLRLVKRQHAGLKPFDEQVQKELREKLRNEIGNREMKRVQMSLLSKAVIEYPE